MFGYVVLMIGGLVFAAMIFRYDMHEREPWWMLAGASVAGALGMWGAFELEGVFEAALVDGGPGLDYRATKSVLAGTIEELAKLAVPVGVLLLLRKHFNDPMDGLIYGSMAGLGAAIFESIWWQENVHSLAGTKQLVANGQTALRLFVHTIWGGIGGYALGLIVMKKPWRLRLAVTVGLVMVIHTAWDYFIGFAPEQGNWHRLLAAVLLCVSIAWYGTLVLKTNRWSRAMHAPDSKKKLTGRLLTRIIKFVLFRKLR